MAKSKYDTYVSHREQGPRVLVQIRGGSPEFREEVGRMVQAAAGLVDAWRELLAAKRALNSAGPGSDAETLARELEARAIQAGMDALACAGLNHEMPTKGEVLGH